MIANSYCQQSFLYHTHGGVGGSWHLDTVLHSVSSLLRTTVESQEVQTESELQVASRSGQQTETPSW